MIKGLAQLQHRFNDNLSIIPGIYTQYYTLTKDISVEHRVGLKWNVNRCLSFNAGSGLYSQLQPRQIYFFIDEDGSMPIKKLEMSRSWQSAAGFDYNFSSAIRFKAEVYYQYLYNIPVISDRPEESILNLGDTQIDDAIDTYYTRKNPNYFKTNLNIGMKTN